MKKAAITDVLNQAVQSGVTTLNTYEEADKKRNKPSTRKKIEEKIDKPVSLYFTQTQYDLLEKMAKQDYVSTSLFIKRLILKFIDQNRNKI